MLHKRRWEALECRPTPRSGATLQHPSHFIHLRNRHSLKHKRKHSPVLQMHEVSAPHLAHARIQCCQQQPQQMGPGVQDGNLPWAGGGGGTRQKTKRILTSVPSPKRNTLPHSSKVHSLHMIFLLHYFHLLFTL